MALSSVDYVIIVGFFVVSILIGVVASRRAGKNFNEYFLAGGQMSWWMLGISMVATTFAADTPNLVTNIVRKNGVSGNWEWWALLLTGLLTVFVYARLWKRSGVLTDLEFYELRYSGKPASYLRGFRAIYLGVIFNCLVMANVILAGIKIGGILLGATPIQVVVIAGTVTVVYTLIGGLRGVILTDCFQFVFAMVGAMAAAWYVCGLPEVGGFSNLLVHENVREKIDLVPDFSKVDVVVPLLIIPLAVQWWSSWYPGAEPGGGGYVAQRMLGAKSEKDATAAMLGFQIAHYALRPWPWIVVALGSLIVFPSVASIQEAFPNVEASGIDNDSAYPAMLSLLPGGLKGIVIAGLIAAFLSTISTHLNWGASYLSNDFYRRFIHPDASDQRLVFVGRVSTVGLMIFAALIALTLENSLEGFRIILQIGAGTGLIYILRWFWWRINAFSEISAMIVSYLIAIFFQYFCKDPGFGPYDSSAKLTIGVFVTTAVWLLVTLVTPPTDSKTLEHFVQKIRPGGNGWRPVQKKLAEQGVVIEPGDSIAIGIAAMFVTTFLIYAILFGTGYFLYGQWLSFVISLLVAIAAAVSLVKIWPRLELDRD